MAHSCGYYFDKRWSHQNGLCPNNGAKNSKQLHFILFICTSMCAVPKGCNSIFMCVKLWVLSSIIVFISTLICDQSSHFYISGGGWGCPILLVEGKSYVIKKRNMLTKNLQRWCQSGVGSLIYLVKHSRLEMFNAIHEIWYRIRPL